MLSKPEAGWTEFQLAGSPCYPLSYLTDIPADWLDQAIHGLTALQPFVVHGYCEPGRMVCLVSFRSCYVLFEDEDCQDRQLPDNMTAAAITMLDFCRMLHRDLSANVAAWVRWDARLRACGDDGQESTRAMLQARKKQLAEKLNILGGLISQRAEAFSPGRVFL